MRSKEKKEEKYYYRIGENTKYDSTPYKVVNNICDSAEEVEGFLKKNFVFTVSKMTGILKGVYGKDVVIIKSGNSFLEMEKPIYDMYKNIIDEINYHNMNEAVEKYANQDNTKIEMNLRTSGCDYMVKSDGKNLLDSKIICGLETLYVSFVNSFDMELFRNIIIDFFEVSPNCYYEFLCDGNILVTNGKKTMILNKMAFNKMKEVLIEYKNQKKGYAKQLKLEG